MENNEVKKGSKRPYVIAIALALALVITITATSYAYFVGTVNNTTTPTTTDVTTTSLGIEFTDGAQVTLENAIPGAYVVKTFKVENVGNGDTVYDVYMSDLINDFSDKTDLVYTLTSNDGGANITTQTQVPASSTKIVSNQLLRVGEEHNYTLRIEFKETNDNQDDNKGKIFSTIIRINEVQEAGPVLSGAAATIANLALTDSSLVVDDTSDENVRYIGANPNNYVRFNNELWRIVGVMNNIENEGGQTQSLLKIIRAESLGKYSWDTSYGYLKSIYGSGADPGVNSGFGINQWGASTYENGDPYEGADLMRELNNDYLGNIIVGTEGYWYNDGSNKKQGDMPTTTLSSTSQGMIETVVWNLGSQNNDNGTAIASNDSLLIAPFVYTHERANTHGKLCEQSDECNDTVVRTTTWTGKVALIYPSDYLYATSGGSETNRQACLNKTMYSWTGSSDCYRNDWLYIQNQDQWTLTPFANSSSAYRVSTMDRGDWSASLNASAGVVVRPAVFLKSSVIITGGTGTQADPYTLSM